VEKHPVAFGGHEQDSCWRDKDAAIQLVAAKRKFE
jgi:hypothetical protein